MTLRSKITQDPPSVEVTLDLTDVLVAAKQHGYYVVSALGNRPNRNRRMNSSVAFWGVIPRCIGTPKHFSTVKK